MPTQREASPLLLRGAAGRTRVALALRMKVSSATGPVLKAGPMAARVVGRAVAKATARRGRDGDMVGDGEVVSAVRRLRGVDGLTG